MPPEDAIATTTPLRLPRRAGAAGDPGRGALQKSFRIPTHRVDSLKERAVHPFAAREYRELRALDGISFEIRQGEFFGIVGRNGSGKSTLLKLLASIYRADAGRIRMAGRLAPFIELGVGFNLELTARENVVLNGVMMGLTPQRDARRLDAVIEFAELEEFVDLKLKNYSSGMLVRLAFSLMMQVDADVLLIDEVLAVGDAAFQQKCADAFHEMKARGQDDRPRHPRRWRPSRLLPPGDADRRRRDPVTSATRPRSARQYLRLNFERRTERRRPGDRAADGDEVAAASSSGSRTRAGERGDPSSTARRSGCGSSSRSLRDLPGIERRLPRRPTPTASASSISALPLDGEPGRARSSRAGQRVGSRPTSRTRSPPGRYFVHCGINRGGQPRATRPLRPQRASTSSSSAATQPRGVVTLAHEIDGAIEEAEPMSARPPRRRPAARGAAAPRPSAAAGAASSTCSG